MIEHVAIEHEAVGFWKHWRTANKNHQSKQNTKNAADRHNRQAEGAVPDSIITRLKLSVVPKISKLHASNFGNPELASVNSKLIDATDTVYTRQILTPTWCWSDTIKIVHC